MRARRGTGSLRERSPGVWEIASLSASTLLTGSVCSVRSPCMATRRGHSAGAANWSTTTGSTGSGHLTSAGLNVAELLARFMAGPHLWKPATYASHHHVVDDVIADRLARRPLLTLTPGTVRAAIVRWQSCGSSVATVSARRLVLRSALSSAVTEGLLRSNPLAGVRGPPRPRPRLHHTLDEVHRMLTVAEADVTRLSAALQEDPTSLRWR